MANGKLKVGVIGCGNIFNLAHKPALEKIQSIKVAACMDVDEERAVKGAKYFNAKAFVDLNEFLDLDLDVVEILTPTYTHAELALAALKKGKHVIIEKPIALTSEEAEKMIKVAEKEGLKLFVGHVRRFDKRWVQIKDVIKNRNILPMQIKKNEVQGLPFPSDYWYWDESKSGGVALDLGVHVTDFLRWLFESEPVEVFGSGKMIKEQARERNTYDHFVMMIKFEGGKLGIAEVSWAYPYPARYGVFYHHLDIIGKNGRIRYTPMDTPVVGVAKSQFEMPRFSPLLSTFPDAFERELRHFFECIREDKEPTVSAKDALIALKIAEKAKESAKLGKSVEFGGGEE
ncbi:MAG: Gfo/Idh/MocA family oxidoreductase [Palaeococcus sp.]|uniref:Gfo/Idh/MocA family protein n=1 Tax=Palaeococcus sp. (in: euryarchaeotes) TaxID=2820298 RepID=UPI0025E3973D|nr:Gfo/Idh/MocA family oxidoreductase [Palaeococcus sp. (in: euryarchaeotes)]MCD6559093.1 Gfo/Idh/MocA family oxidoreductase [Palaeococcus sp. (in: euryarchaeotes)]